jgi:hypothetical protein
VSFSHLAWAFVAAVAIHNLEEALYLPSWSRSAGTFHPAVGATEFRFAVLGLMLLAAFCAAGAAAGSVTATYLTCGYALAMAVNAFVPHAAATVALRRYMPGTLTGLALNLPIGSWLIYDALREGLINAATFLWAAPLVMLFIAAIIPLLFMVGRGLSRRFGGGAHSLRT